MTLTLSSTALALSIANRIGQTQHSLDTVSERLSSGLRVGIDDAADLSIAEKLKVDARVFTQGVRNVNEGISLANTTEVSLRELEAITLRQIELAQQSANGATSANQRRALDAEANALVDEFNRIVDSTQFNGISTLQEDVQDVFISPAAGTEGDLIQIETNEELQRTVGDGTFVNDGSYAVSTITVTEIHTGDVNNDGLDDIVSLSPGLDRFNVSLGQADGSLGASTVVSGNDPNVRTPTLADFDNDGDLEVVTSENNDTLYFYENDGSGSFSYGDATVLFGAGDLNYLQADDIDGDGNVDIVGTATADFVTQDTFSSLSDVDTGTDNITLVNHGFETGDVVQLTTTGTLPAPLATLTDYYVINIDANTIQLATSAVNAGTGTQIDLTTVGTGEHTITNTETGPGVAVAFGNGDGTFSNTVYSQLTNGAGELKIGDFDGDGEKDVVVRNSADLEFLFGDGAGTFSDMQTFNVGGNMSSVEVADFDGDGYADVAVTNLASSRLQTYQGSATGVSSTGNSYIVPAAAADVTVGDFNGDGIVDLATASAQGGGAAVTIFTGDGEGDFSQQASESIASQVGIASLDVNGDGVTDLAVLNGTRDVDMLLGNATQETRIAYINLTTQDNALESLDTLEENRLRVARELGEVGASLSRLGTTVTSLEVMRDETIGAENRVTEVDLAQEVAEMTALRIRRDAATALLGQLTVTPTLALELLQSSLV